MTLADWQKNGWLHEHETSKQEIRDLLNVIERDLKDCTAPGLSADWRLNIAYNAALQAAVASLAAAGYRATHESHHFRVFQSLAQTLALDSTSLSVLERFRKKRNTLAYERAGTVSDKEAKEMLELAKELKEKVLHVLRKNHPDLI